MSDNPVDIYIIGTGMRGYRQITKEAEAAIEASERLYSIHLSDLYDGYLSEFDIERVDLRDYYQEGKDRVDTYEEIAETVLDAGESCSAPITFAIYGHPMVFVSPSEIVIDRADERGLTVETRPGISSMDCLYVDLEIDPGKGGIQMFEATDMLLREWELNPEVPAMIWQIGAVESSIHHTSVEDKPERYSRVREYLQQFYPDDHSVVAAQTPIYPTTEPKQYEFQLDEFESMHEDLNKLQTLYIPPVRQRPTQNQDLAERFRTSDHLETITSQELE
jgi:uncharacterized protein YabN with tetrapyrrole methylase and pyrophosphatase domain